MGIFSLFESVPNFSEGRRDEVIRAVAGAATAAHLLDIDSDVDHNRAVITLAGNAAQLQDALPAMTEAAIRDIDVSTHSGVHPRVGVADVIPIVPLRYASLNDAREVAHAIGKRLWSELHLPIYFYGHGESKTLADIRAGRVRPDLGGPEPHPTAGAACVGAREKLVAFNVLLPDTDLPSARALARSLRESAGGVRGVQALAFQLPSGAVQLSMNLFRLEETTPAMVLRELAGRGVRLGQEEVVGLCPARVATEAATGKLLEGRLGSAAARMAARKCAQIDDEEHQRLAVKLAQEAVDLAVLGIDQVEILVGAERMLALERMLAPAQVVDPTLHSMLFVAGEGLVDALSRETMAAYPERANHILFNFTIRAKG